MIHIEPIFPTYLYLEEEIDNFNLVQEEISGVVDATDFKFLEDWSTHWVSNSFEESIIDKLPLLKEEVTKNLANYCKHMGFDDAVTENFPSQRLLMEYESSWIAKFEKNNYAHIHSHRYSDISGAYYFKTPEGGGDIFFHTPIAYQEASRWWMHEREPLQPKEGMLILFPGWLRHGVVTNTSDESRMSISFNVKLSKLNKM
tara:strand:- start:4784 stop:5386 length:603 start_codon:yes stop_codon:yes gene_type:complete